MKNLFRCLALSLALLGLPSAAAVEVGFLPADQYADIGDGVDARRALREIREHLVKLGERYLQTGLRLSIDVLEVDLAGNLQIFDGPDGWERVLTGKADAPVLRLRHTLRLGEQIQRQGEDTLTDPMYLDHSDGHNSDAPLYHEKVLLERWFRTRFGMRATRIEPVGR
jgi:hypothetical protein